MTVTEELRRAMNASGETRYSIAQTTRINESILSRFARGKTTLGGENIDRLAAHLGMVMVKKPERARKKR